MSKALLTMDMESAISKKEVIQCVAQLVEKAAKVLPDDVLNALIEAYKRERNYGAKKILEILIENARIAKEKNLPICQDTGIDCIFATVGQGLLLDFDLKEAICQGVRQGTREGYLRVSVADPLTRINTGDNTPPIVHFELIPERCLEITVLPKGCGSENMSALYMLPPSSGREGIVSRVIERVVEAGANPCPPGIIGIGIGGTMEKAALLAKKALLRPIGTHHEREDVRKMEEELLERINGLGLGPLGLGGDTTSLWVAMEVYPCHIASLPVAINYQCHAARRARAVLHNGQMEIVE